MIQFLRLILFSIFLSFLLLSFAILSGEIVSNDWLVASLEPLPMKQIYLLGFLVHISAAAFFILSYFVKPTTEDLLRSAFNTMLALFILCITASVSNLFTSRIEITYGGLRFLIDRSNSGDPYLAQILVSIFLVLTWTELRKTDSKRTP